MKKFHYQINNLSLQTKTILFVAIIVLVPLLIIVTSLFVTITKTVMDVEKKSLEKATLLAEQKMVSNVEAHAQIYDLNFNNMMVDLETLKNKIIETDFNQTFLVDYYNKHQIVSNVYFINNASAIFSERPMANYKQGEIINLAEIKIFDFLNSQTESRDTPRWLGPYTDYKNQQTVITYIIPLWHEGKYLGLVGFDLLTNSLFSEITNFNPTESSYLFIIKNNGDFISSSKKIYKDLQLSESSNNVFDSPIINRGEMITLLSVSGQKSGLFIMPSDATTEKIGVFASIPSFSGKIIIVSPVDEIVHAEKEKAEELSKTFYNIGFNSIKYSLFITLLIAALSFFLSKKNIIDPVKKLKRGIENFDAQGLSQTITVTNDDEIGKLTEAFNKMSKNIGSIKTQLEIRNKTLEQQAIDKTKELEKSKKELEEKIDIQEKFNNVAVDRELKMIKLKQESERLKKEIEKLKK